CDALPNFAALEPRGDRARVPLGGTRRGPRGVDGDLPRHPVELHLRPGDGRDRKRADLRDEAAVTSRASPADQEMVALRPRLVRGDAHLLREPVDRVVSRSEKRASAIDAGAVGQTVCPDATPDAITRLQDDDRPTRVGQPTRGGEPCVPGAEHADVPLDTLPHPRYPSP